MPGTEAGASTQTEADHKATITAEALVEQYNSNRDSGAFDNTAMIRAKAQQETETVRAIIIKRLETILKNMLAKTGEHLNFNPKDYNSGTGRVEESVDDYILRIQGNKNGASLREAFDSIMQTTSMGYKDIESANPSDEHLGKGSV